MALSFFKKSFSAAYNGYQNKISNPDTLQEEDDEESSDENEESDNEIKSTIKLENRIERIGRSKSAIEIVNLAKRSLVDKLSSNVTKLATYDHHSLLKSIQKEDDSNQEEDEDFVDKKDQLKENISFNLYEQDRNLSLKPDQSFGLINPFALPIEIKEQILNDVKLDFEDDYDDDSSNEYERINFDKYDEYGFVKLTKKTIEEENLLKIIDSDEIIHCGSKDDEIRKDEIRKDETRKDETKKDETRKDEIENHRKEDEQFERLKNKWLTYLELTYNQVDEPTTKWYQVESKIKHTAQLDNLIQSGSIPYFLRNQLWLRFSDAYLMKEKCELTYSELCKKSVHLKSFNNRHSIRILPNNICFQDQSNKINQSLRRILRVIKWIERNGIDHLSTNNLEQLNLPLIVAYLLLILNEESVFWLILSILNEFKLIFTNKNHLIVRSSTTEDDLIKNLIKKYCPELDEKLNREEIDINILINCWFASLFADIISDTHILFYLWDLFFYYGFIVIFQLTFGLLIHHKDTLIQLDSSVDLINKISGLPDQLNSNEKLLKIWQIGKDSLENLDQEFYSIKNQNELQSELLRIGVPAVQLFSETTAGIKLTTSNSLNHLSDLNKEMKFKNVRQSAILMELHEAILSIAKHFSQSNDSDLKFNLDIDYDLKEVNKIYKTRKTDLNKMSGNKNEKKKIKCKRARALVDFKRIDDDELGFRKNDIIKILNDSDEHCWMGELNEQQGLFPAKFCEVLNENFGSYSEFGDDKVTPFINDLVRGRLCAVIKCILNNGLRKSYFFNTNHPWMIIDTLAKNYIKNQQNNICSKLVLTKCFKLDDFENNLNVRELFYKLVILINETHLNEAMDIKLRSLICVALNHKILAEFFTIYCNEDKNLIKSYYHDWSYVTTPVWQMVRLEFALLKQFSFNLNPNAELIEEINQPSSSVSKTHVHDMLIKHHLFSWNL